MAKLTYIGPIRETIPIAPGHSVWVSFGQAEGYERAALAVSAHAHKGTGGSPHVLKVDNVNVITTQGIGEIPRMTYDAGCNITNNGRTTITEWTVMVGAILPA
jgi:hypothetical protein